MGIKTSPLREPHPNIGQVFTPLKWAKWLINTWDIFDAWLDGAHICEPTAGQGVFALAMLHIARRKGIPITPERLSRLTLIEIVPAHLARFRENVKRDFGLDFPASQLFLQDVIMEKHERRYDILLGNPPWANFTELPSDYKERVKPFFLAEGLVPDSRKMLLGNSRIDIAALVLKVVLGKLLETNGCGYFYLPLSLFFGDGAHCGFRNYRANHRNFAVDTVYEWTTTKVFEGVSTAYGCARFRGDTEQRFPVTYFKEHRDASVGEPSHSQHAFANRVHWREQKAVPLKNRDDPWRVVQTLEEIKTGTGLDIRLSAAQTPRQGINTCGAKNVFVFERKPAHIPEEFLYPLATKETWRQAIPSPCKWILLPYHPQTGKPLAWHQIRQHDALRRHLQDAQERLQARKGTFLRAAINKGCWWAVLGVGPYAFAPFKVIWEAYGRSEFNPIVLADVDGQVWHGDQAMHAFIPCWTGQDAQRIKTALEHPEIPALLRQLNGAGKCNWAQPGKIRKILSFNADEQDYPKLLF